MLDIRLYIAQRIAALVMVPLVIGHIAVMIIAIQGGLSAAEILSRTQGSLGWALFYGTFVAAVAVHAAIGIRTILSETLRLNGTRLNFLALAILFVLLGLGGDAVWAVTFAGGAP